jgi:competence protein ComEC
VTQGAVGGVDPPAARLDLRLVLPAVAAWLGAIVGTGTRSADWPVLVAGCAAAVLAASVAWRQARLATAAVLLCATLGLGVAGLRVAQIHLGPVDGLARRRAVVEVALVVTGDPRLHLGRTSGQQRGQDLYVVPARLLVVSTGGYRAGIRSPVLVLATDRRWQDLLPGQHLTTWGRLEPARPGQPLAAVVMVRGPPHLVGRPPAVQRVAGSLRAGLRSAVRGLPVAERGLVPGLVVGDTSGMPADLVDEFRTAGLTHLVAVSGANLAIVCGFVLWLGRWAGLRGRLLPACGALALLGFVILARPQPSVLRAGAMGLVGLLALATGRRRGSLAALGAAVLALVVVDPWLARSYGFALSVLATGGLLLLAGPWAERLRAAGVPGPVAAALAVPGAAQVACAPVIALLSGQVSLVAVFANLLAAPAVAPATVLGVLATLAGGFSARIAVALGWAAGAPAWWIVTVAHRSAAVPHATLPWAASWSGALLLAGLLLAGVLLAPRVARHRRAAAASAVTLLVACTVRLAAPVWPPTGWLLVACDVGQGDALVVSTGPHSAVVVDTGPDPRLVDRCLRDLRVSWVPLVLLTHLHADHVEGLPGVLRGRRVGEVMRGLYDEPAAELVRVTRWAGAAHVPITRTVVGDRVQVGSLSWRVLWPERVIDGEGSTPNNSSVVVLAETGGVRLLLTGDVEPAAQRAILTRWKPEQVDVLKVPHHGSAYQEPAFLAAVHPRLAMICVGVDNDYGHPAPETVRRLAALGAVVGRTDRDGPLAVVGPAAHLRLVRAGR